MSVPALRFKDEAGEDFPDWEAKKIGDFILSHKGGAPLKPSDFVKYGDFEVIPKKAISSGGYLKLDETEPTYCSGDFFEANQRSVVDSSYLIITLRDLVPSGPSIGYIVKYTSNKKYILAQGVYGIQIDEKLINDFLTQYSNTDNYRVLMQTMMVGSTQVHIRNSDFFQTPFSVPCFKEQTKIANLLTAVDEKITHLTQKHDLLTQYKKGVMQQIFSHSKERSDCTVTYPRGISQELRFKDDDGQDFPEWEEAGFDELFYVANNKKTQIKSSDYLEQGNTPIVDQGQKHIVGYTNNTEIYKDVPVIIFGDHTRILKWIDFVFASGADGTQVLKSTDKLNLKFGYYTLCHIELPNLGYSRHMKELKNQFIIIPTSIVEQTKIANFLTAIDDKITATQTQLQAVKQYKQGLLQQMFV